MTRDGWVVLSAVIGAAFAAGMWVGEERSAAQLRPCPQDGKASLMKLEVAGQVCTYAEIVRGKKFKWEIRKL